MGTFTFDNPEQSRIESYVCPETTWCSNLPLDKKRSNFCFQRSTSIVQNVFFWKCSVLINTNKSKKDSAKTYELLRTLKSFSNVYPHIENKRIRSQLPLLKAALLRYCSGPFEFVTGLLQLYLTFSQTTETEHFSNTFASS